MRSARRERSELRYLRPDLRAEALLQGAVALALFAAGPASHGVSTDAAAFGLVAAAVATAFLFVLTTWDRVPQGDLPPVPPGGPVVERRPAFFALIALVAVSAFAIVWFAPRSGNGAAVLAGVVAGRALATAAGWWLVRRWERATGRRAVFDSAVPDRLFAG